MTFKLYSQKELENMPHQCKVPYVLVRRFCEFLDTRINQTPKGSARGRLIDLQTLATAGLPITEPPKFVLNYLYKMVKDIDETAVWKEYELASL